MLQRKFGRVLVAAIFFFAGCDRSAPPQSASTKPSTTTHSSETVVSLSPAATDLILGMNAGDQLVGVSTYDSDPRVATLPRVGDYENVDWERITTLAPKHMVVQMAPERLPAGFKERAAKLGIVLYNSHIDRLDDITREADGIGAAIGQAEAAHAFVKALHAPIEAVKARTATQPRVRTLISVSDDGTGLAGRGTYLDDLLVAAGGENALAADAGSWVKLDREALLAVAPDAIIQLSPSPTAAQREANRRAWAGLSSLPAVKNGRVLVIDEAWALMPGAHVGDLAQRFADFLHPVAP